MVMSNAMVKTLESIRLTAACGAMPRDGVWCNSTLLEPWKRYESVK